MSNWEKQALSDIDEFARRPDGSEPDWNAPEKKLDAARKKRDRQSRVINRAYVRRWALDYAKYKRPFVGFGYVSEDFLNAVEAATKAFIRDRVERHPTRGKTLK